MKKILHLIFGLSPTRVSIYITFAMLALYLFNIDGGLTLLNLPDKKWIDFIQDSRGSAEHTDQVVIAVVDTKSVDKYGRWPWSRDVIAKVVESLNDYYQVRTIGFDIVFSEPLDNHLKLARSYQDAFDKSGIEKTPDARAFMDQMKIMEKEEDGDAKLGKVFSKAKNVIHGYTFFNQKSVPYLSDKEVRKAQARLRTSAISKVEGYGKLKESLFVTEGYYPETTIRKISGRKPNMGFFTVRIDPEDGVVRQVESVIRVGKRFFPSLALQMLAHYLGSKIEISGDETGILEVRLGEKVLYPFRDGAFRINYKGPEGTFKHHSMYEIVERTIPVEELKGKMVLMGVTEVGILDLRVTPVGEAYAGVEVHANLLDNLLSDTYFRQDLRNDLITMALILFFGLLLGFAMPRMKFIYMVTMVTGLLVAYTFAHRYIVLEWYSWPSYFYVALTIFLSAVGVVSYMFFIADADKRFIQGAFQQYLSPAVITQLMDDPDMLQLGGEERVMTAMFSDVKGFSSISEQLTPNELVQLLNEYLTEMSDIILKYEGTVDKFEGDAIIAFFGAPVDFPDHATRAALVCLEMQNRLAEMRLQWKKEGRQELYHRIGINTGPMVVGNMGSSSRFDYTMMGNDVNLAARLEGVNKMYKNEILMSEKTYQACRETIDARELDMIRVMGIKEPVKIYEILGRIGEIDKHRQDAFKLYAQGLAQYRAQEWSLAEKSFKETLGLIPNDGPSSVFLERCFEYQKSPPPPNWDQVYVATSK
ncbi:MAG: adenylate/guanylate cyclase domain-containing protein [SAR324 cluster bacterium]|nr:adenylate/guanylate cyclase domain-containing protein [SAR324 cluster bacterium]